MGAIQRNYEMNSGWKKEGGSLEDTQGPRKILSHKLCMPEATRRRGSGSLPCLRHAGLIARQDFVEYLVAFHVPQAGLPTRDI